MLGVLKKILLLIVSYVLICRFYCIHLFFFSCIQLLFFTPIRKLIGTYLLKTKFKKKKENI